MYYCNVATMCCESCMDEGHSVLKDDHYVKQAPCCFVLTDQVFPGSMPAEGEGTCAMIIMGEDATLHELVKLFQKITEGSKIPVGSALIISSLSHLSRSGVADYVESFCSAVKKLEQDYSRRVRIVHGLPIPHEVVVNGTTSRYILDVMDWLEDLDCSGIYSLRKTTAMYKELLLREKAEVPFCYRLPTWVTGRERANFKTNGLTNLRATLGGWPKADWHRVIKCMMEELNDEFALDLCLKPDLSGDRSKRAPLLPRRIIAAGGSHMRNLVTEIRNIVSKKVDIVDLSVGGWKLNELNASGLRVDLEQQLQNDRHPDVLVIVHPFDNALYGDRGGNGSVREAVLEDEKYHYPGSIVVGAKRSVGELYNMRVPALRETKGCTTLLITP